MAAPADRPRPARKLASEWLARVLKLVENEPTAKHNNNSAPNSIKSSAARAAVWVAKIRPQAKAAECKRIYQSRAFKLQTELFGF